MPTRNSKAKKVTKAARIRLYRKENPKATPEEIAKALSTRKEKITASYVSNVFYADRVKKGPAKSVSKRKRGPAGPSKEEHQAAMQSRPGEVGPDALKAAKEVVNAQFAGDPDYAIRSIEQLQELQLA